MANFDNGSITVNCLTRGGSPHHITAPINYFTQYHEIKGYDFAGMLDTVYRIHEERLNMPITGFFIEAK